MNRRQFVQLAAVVPVAAASVKPMRLGLIVPVERDPDAAIRKVHDLGLPTCQVELKSFEPGLAEALRGALDRYGVEATSAVAVGPGEEVYDFYAGPLTIGLVPRATRAARIARVNATSDFAKVRQVAAYCRKNGQTFRCETGQETPITLLRTIRDVGLDNVGVNFDGANLILYGKADPVEALDVLGPLVMGVHAKDGLYPVDPKYLGRETPIGQGKVNFPRFIWRLKDIGYTGPITIEREISGPKQLEDIRAAKAYLEKLIG
jgi:sugar phosphate isomerase/epimerase